MSKIGDRYAEFLEKILQQTKDDKLMWHYLDENESLYKGMNWTRRSTHIGPLGEQVMLRPGFDIENSFYCRINQTSLVILVQNGRPASFYIVPSTFKKVVALTADEYGNLITRLLNLVQTLFPDGESFIDSFLQDGEDEKR